MNWRAPQVLRSMVLVDPDSPVSSRDGPGEGKKSPRNYPTPILASYSYRRMRIFSLSRLEQVSNVLIPS